jgi:anthranilate synthase/aminodeoxychorismate synthase-like glutamine amidotransferase
VVQAVFPAGTLSGAPKIRAMEIIEELEPSRRGIYGGAVGYFSYTGNIDLSIAIRTMVTLGDKIYVQAGAGIVADSVPADEYQECVNKAGAVVSAVEIARRAAGGGESLMILVIDNYDSFTYNLVQYLGELGQEVRVVRNDEIAAADIAGLAPSKIVISPGPCTPNEAGISLEVIKTYAGKIPILGVCLGHQAIGQAFGGKIVRAARIMHGKTSKIFHDGRGVFTGLPNPFEATRYHSLLIERASVPECLEVTARTADEEIMAVRQ